MPAYTLTHVADDKLLADLAALTIRDRHTTAALLAHIGEVDARELYKPAACSSMHVYCTQVLHLAEEVAFKRIRAARAARRFPVLFDAIADGRMHVTGVVMLAPHLTDANVDALVAEATHRSKSELEVIVARLAPRPDLPEALLPVRLEPDPVPERASKLDPDPVPPGPPPRARVEARSPDRYGLQVTIDQATRDKLERAQALLRHSNPSGDLAVVLDRALDALLEKLEKQQFGATSRPRATKARAESADPSHVSNAVRRETHARDGGQCAYVSADGVRCTSRAFLQLDHKTPRSRGGLPTTANMRWYCSTHNQYAADEELGRDFMRARRAAAKLERARRAAAKRRAAAERPAGSERRADAAERSAGAEPRAAEPSLDAARLAESAPESARMRKPTRDSARLEERAAVKAPGETNAAAAIANATAASSSAAAANAAAEKKVEAARIDADVTSALRGLGFKVDETRAAMQSTAEVPATTFEERLRAALGALHRRYRCSEGVFDAASDGNEWWWRDFTAMSQTRGEGMAIEVGVDHMGRGGGNDVQVAPQATGDQGVSATARTVAARDARAEAALHAG